ncbi:MAG: helix-turn-helix domain-containing protein [Pseudomonadota bacterium]
MHGVFLPDELNTRITQRHAARSQPQPACKAEVATVKSLTMEEAVQQCDCVIDIISQLFDISSREIRSSTRNSASVARVRQIGMYVCHVTLGMYLQQISEGFSRDRSTVTHACHLVEDLRDDEEIDRIIAKVEAVIAAALRPNKRAKP